MKSVLISALIALSIIVLGSNAQKETIVKLYEHEGLKGLSLPVQLRGTNCYNIQPNWVGHASSVDIGPACVILFDGPNCDNGRNRGLRLDTQNDRGANKLEDVDMNDKAASIRLC